jgi:hypothetical protein
VITCDIKAGKCLEFHNRFPHGISCYDCTRAWIAKLRIQVAELGQVDLQQTNHSRISVKKLEPVLYAAVGNNKLPLMCLHKIKNSYVHGCCAGPPIAGSDTGEKMYTVSAGRMDRLKIITLNRKH